MGGSQIQLAIFTNNSNYTCTFIETWIVYVCHSEQDIRIWCFWTKDGSRCHAHLCQELQRGWVFTLNSFLCVSRMVHHPKDIEPTWHNCGKHWSQWRMLSTPCSPSPDKLSLFRGQKGSQLPSSYTSIQKALWSLSASVNGIPLGEICTSVTWCHPLPHYAPSPLLSSSSLIPWFVTSYLSQHDKTLD